MAEAGEWAHWLPIYNALAARRRSGEKLGLCDAWLLWDFASRLYPPNSFEVADATRAVSEARAEAEPMRESTPWRGQLVLCGLGDRPGRVLNEPLLGGKYVFLYVRMFEPTPDEMARAGISLWYMDECWRVPARGK